MTGAVAWAILIPLAGAMLSALVGSHAARWVALGTTAGTLGIAVAVTWSVAIDGPLHVSVGGWGTPLGIDLRADGLAAVMLLTIALVGAVLSLDAITRGSTNGRLASRFYALWFFAWAALDALVLSNDVFNLYVTLELTTLAAVGLIAIGGDRGALRAALRYLLFAIPGSLVYLLGVALLYGIHATLDITQLGARVDSSSSTWTALALMTIGLCLKAALFPLHAWLPAAYATARPVVGALLSGSIGKAAFLVLVKLWLGVFPDDFARLAGYLLASLGAGAILWGSLVALLQSRLKLVIAYSSVAQVGYLFVWFSLGTPGAWSGAVYVAISHAAAAAAMFVAAGTIERALGGDELDRVRGLSNRFPVTFFAVALAGVSLMGMPPTGGFIGKWLLVRAAFETGQWWWAVVMVTGGLLAAGYVFRILRRAFLPIARDATVRPVAFAGELAALGLALVGVVLGMTPGLTLELLAVGSPR
jgi:formate hydrogenlyase subunit 3/multisubunit Na+/H+ antiporter MnhD subunit